MLLSAGQIILHFRKYSLFLNFKFSEAEVFLLVIRFVCTGYLHVVRCAEKEAAFEGTAIDLSFILGLS